MTPENPDHGTVATDKLAIARIAALAMLVVVPSVILILVFRFNGLYGQDAYAYYGYAMGPLRDALRALEPPPPFFWPPGYPLLVAASSLVLGTGPWVGQFISVAAAAVTPVGVYLLTREFQWGTTIPLTAAVLTGLSGMLWQAGIATMSDATGIGLATFGVWAAVRYCRAMQSSGTSGALWCLLAATLMGGAAMTRVVYGLVLFPVALYTGVVWFEHRARVAWWPGLIAGLWYLALTSPLWHPLLLGVAHEPEFGGSFQVHTWNPLNAIRSTFEGVDGVRQYRFPNWFYYSTTFARGFFFTPLLAPFLFVGIWQSMRRLPLTANILILGWPLILLLFFIGDEYQNARFALAALPPMALLTSVGINKTRERLGSTWRRQFNTWVLVGLLAMVLGGSNYVGRIMGRKNQDIATVQWVTATVPPDAQIITFGLTQTFSFETDLPVHDLYGLNPSDLATILSDRETYVVLDMRTINTQWLGHAPGINYQWLRDNGRLMPLGQFGTYTMFRVDQTEQL